MQDNEWDSSVTVEGYVAKPDRKSEPLHERDQPRLFRDPGRAHRGRPRLRPARPEEHRSTARGTTTGSPRVVIVNEKFARMFFGDGSALGRRVGFGSDPGTPTDMEIVGVVKDIKYTSLRDEIPIQMFVPYLADRNVGEHDGLRPHAAAARGARDGGPRARGPARSPDAALRRADHGEADLRLPAHRAAGGGAVLGLRPDRDPAGLRRASTA